MQALWDHIELHLRCKRWEGTRTHTNPLNGFHITFYECLKALQKGDESPQAPLNVDKRLKALSNGGECWRLGRLSTADPPRYYIRECAYTVSFQGVSAPFLCRI